MVGLTWCLNLAAFVFVAANADDTTNRQQRQSNNIFGVASHAGITSRNGRISTTRGVHFYPGVNDYYSSGHHTGDYYSPITFTKAIDGKYASGSVQILPGALGVSSSAQAGYIPGNSWPEWPRQWQWPVQSQFYTSDPWAKKVELPQSNVRQQWMYPSFSPFFNFWR